MSDEEITKIDIEACRALSKEIPNLKFMTSAYLSDGTCMVNPKTFHYLHKAFGPLLIVEELSDE